MRTIDYAYSIGLSTREAAVLVLAAISGLHRKEAAHRLGCQPSTVDTYWRRIMRKARVGSSLEVLSALLAFVVANQEAGHVPSYRAAIDVNVCGKLEPAPVPYCDQYWKA